MADAMQGKDAVEFLESLIVGDVASLEDRTGTLSVFTNDKGGIIDDSVITKVCCENSIASRYVCCVAAAKHLHRGCLQCCASTCCHDHLQMIY